MSLVSEKTRMKWGQKDSYYYKNFAFLFSNKLWDKNVPQGFPVCPLFWIAHFSNFIFKPFIYYPLLLLKFLLLQTCRPARGFDGVCTKLMLKMGIPKSIADHGVLVPILGIFLLTCLGCASMMWYGVMLYTSTIPGYQVTFWAVHAFAALCIFRAVMRYKYPCGYCAENGWTLSALFLAALAGATALLVPGTFAMIGAGIAEFFRVCWFALGEVVHTVFVAWIWTFLVWAFTGALAVWPLLALAAGGILITGIIGFLADRAFPEAKKEFIPKKPEPDYTWEWEVYLIRVIEQWLSSDLRVFFDKDAFNPYRVEATGEVVPSFRKYTVRLILKDVCAQELKDLKRVKPRISLSDSRGEATDFSDLVSLHYLAEGFDALKAIDKKIFALELDDYVPKEAKGPSKVGKFLGLLDAVFEKAADATFDRFLQEKVDLEERYAKEQRSQERWAKVHKVMHTFMVPISNGLQKLWSAFLYCLKGVGTALLVGWKLLVKGKKVACPYVPFTDPGEANAYVNAQAGTVAEQLLMMETADERIAKLKELRKENPELYEAVKTRIQESTSPDTNG